MLSLVHSENVAYSNFGHFNVCGQADLSCTMINYGSIISSLTISIEFSNKQT